MEAEGVGESGPSESGYPSTYFLGLSKMTEGSLDAMVEDGLMSNDTWLLCRSPDGEKVPKPEPYEAIVFRDFFVAGFRFPCEEFVSAVLLRYNLQIHHLTPNAFTCLGVYMMVLKMMGCELSLETFIRYYAAQLKENILYNKRTEQDVRLEFCSYNFVPVTGHGSVSIVPAYHNKWSDWKSYWFYLRVCSDDEVTLALKNRLERAHAMASLLSPLEGVRKPLSETGGDSDVSAADAFALTS